MPPALLLVLSLAAAPSAVPVPAAAPAPNAVHDDAQAADLAMSRAVEARDPAAFATFLEPEAIFASENGLSGGRGVVVATWRPYLTAGGPTLAWRPDRSLVASRGGNASTPASAPAVHGCGFFHVRDGLIVFQRGYWDKLTFLRAHGLPPPPPPTTTT